MKAMVCELCRSNSFSKREDFYQCDYCRTKFTPEQARRMLVEGTVKIDRSDDTARLLVIARNAFDGGNKLEAYEYANRVLEIDSHNGQAWYIKGASAGWGASLGSVRPKIREMMQCFNAGVASLNGPELNQYRSGCAQAARSIVENLYRSSTQHLRSNLHVQQVWGEHLDRSGVLMDAAEASFGFDNNPQSLKLAIWIASENIEGETRKIANQPPIIRHLVPQHAAHLTDRINRWAHTIRRFEPGFTAPIPKPKRLGACFVVTATFGREDAMPVVLLREFRDEVLLCTSVGQGIISWYYKHGPRAAAHISRSRALRILTLVTVVLPALVITMPLLLINRWLVRHKSRTSMTGP